MVLQTETRRPAPPAEQVEFYIDTRHFRRDPSLEQRRRQELEATANCLRALSLHAGRHGYLLQWWLLPHPVGVQAESLSGPLAVPQVWGFPLIPDARMATLFEGGLPEGFSTCAGAGQSVPPPPVELVEAATVRAVAETPPAGQPRSAADSADPNPDPLVAESQPVSETTTTGGRRLIVDLIRYSQPRSQPAVLFSLLPNTRGCLDRSVQPDETLWRPAESRAPLLRAVTPVDLASGLDEAHHQSLLLLRAHAELQVANEAARIQHRPRLRGTAGAACIRAPMIALLR